MGNKYGAFPGMGNMQNLVRQAQRMQQEMEEKQAKVATETFEATAGGEAVKVVVTGDKRVQKIEIKKEIVDPDDVEMLEDIVLTAVNEALSKADSAMKDTLGGLGLPGLM